MQIRSNIHYCYVNGNRATILSPWNAKEKKSWGRFFIDRKLSVPEKENTWVIESARKIIWVVGLRIDDRCKVTQNPKPLVLFGNRHRPLLNHARTGLGSSVFHDLIEQGRLHHRNEYQGKCQAEQGSPEMSIVIHMIAAFFPYKRT